MLGFGAKHQAPVNGASEEGSSEREEIRTLGCE